MSMIFSDCQESIEVSKKQLDQIRQAAMQSPLKRARLCLHCNHRDKVQEMVIAFCMESYIRPHRHLNKSESFHVIEGKLAVLLFDGKGRVRHQVKMMPLSSNYTFLYRLSSNMWHMVVPLSEFVIIHETTSGPFIKGDTEFASWGPYEDDTDKVKAFLSKIRAKIGK